MKKQLLISFILIIFGFTTYSQPGTIDLTFNPTDVGFGCDADQNIYSISIQSDGKIIIGGSFSSYNCVARNRIARLNTDGTLDTTFNPETEVTDIYSSINSTSIQSDGKIIIGGRLFSTYNGNRNQIARLNTDGTLDTTFNSGTLNGMYDIEIHTTSIQSDGKIIIGGSFTYFNGVATNGIACLNTDGTLDTTFNSGTGVTGSNTGSPFSRINSISIQSDGKLIIGGDFNSYNGVARNGIARLNTDGKLDTTFNPGTGANSIIYSTSIQSDGKIIIGGFFTSYNGVAISRLARLNNNGKLDTTFKPGTGPDNWIYSSSIQSDGKIIIGGTFTSYNGVAINGIARLNTDGKLDTTFNQGTGIGTNNKNIYSTYIQSDGKIVIGGDFNYYDGLVRSFIARLNNNGTLDTTFNPRTGADSYIHTTSIQSDGKLIIGGHFTSYNGVARSRIARLNTDGTLDTTFNQGTGANGTINCISIASDGKIIIGGTFGTYNGTGRNRIARLNTDGTLDTTFNPRIDETGGVITINTTSCQSDGKIIIGGNFISYNGVDRRRIARLNIDGTLDTNFNPGTGTTSDVRNTSIQSDGKIIIGGDFNYYNGVARNGIARLNTDGTLDTTFNPGTGTGANNRIIYSTSIQSDGKIIIGGGFTSFNGVARSRIARLNTDGTLDTTFNQGTGASSTINCISIQSDGKIIIGGGYFTSYNDVARNGIARLNTDGTLDTTFNPETGAAAVLTTSIQSDGKIIIGGGFISYNGTGRNRIARINGGNTLSNSSFDKSKMVIYPNPSNGIYTLQSNEMTAAKSIRIYTILGQKIFDAIISLNETTVDISNQPKGVYLYKVLGEAGETKSGKLVIE